MSPDRPRPVHPESEQGVAKTFNQLWDAAIPRKGNASIIYPDILGIDDLTVDLNKINTPESIAKWKLLLDRLLLNPNKGFKNLTIRESGISIHKFGVPISNQRSLNVNYSYTSATVDINPYSDERYPSDPNKGREQLRFGALEMFTKTRRELTDYLQRISQENTNEGDFVNAKIRDRVMELEGLRQDSQSQVGFAIQSCQCAPLTVLSVIARDTFYYGPKGDRQPINTGGLLIYEEFGGDLSISKLNPNVSFNTWEPMSGPETDAFSSRYPNEIYPHLNDNIRKLAERIRRGK